MSSINIKGNNNQIYDNVKRSRINSDDHSVKINPAVKWVGIVSLIVAIIGLVLKFIVGWDTICQFFK